MRDTQRACRKPPESNLSRKDPRSIPKVFLIDAYEVSWRARTEEVIPRQLAMRPKNLGPPFPTVVGIKQFKNILLDYFCQTPWRIFIVFLRDNRLSEKLKALCLNQSHQPSKIAAHVICKPANFCDAERMDLRASVESLETTPWSWVYLSNGAVLGRVTLVAASPLMRRPSILPI